MLFYDWLWKPWVEQGGNVSAKGTLVLNNLVCTMNTIMKKSDMQHTPDSFTSNGYTAVNQGISTTQIAYRSMHAQYWPEFYYVLAGYAPFE